MHYTVGLFLIKCHRSSSLSPMCKHITCVDFCPHVNRGQMIDEDEEAASLSLLQL